MGRTRTAGEDSSEIGCSSGTRTPHFNLISTPSGLDRDLGVSGSRLRSRWIGISGLDRDRDLGVSDLMSTFQDIGVSAGIMDRDRDRGLGSDQDGSGSLTSCQLFKTGSGSRGLGLLGDRLLIGLLGIACFLRDLLLRVLAGGR